MRKHRRIGYARFRCALPGGAFYAFPNVQGTGIGSKELAGRLLQEAGVACLDGGSFGAYGDGYLRFSYVNSYENLMEAVERIGDWLSSAQQPNQRRQARERQAHQQA